MKGTVKENIDTLAKQGAKVDIYHSRMCDKNGKIAAKGGHTYAIIEINGTKTIGECKCSKKDNYSRKIGAAIALGRAIKKL